VNKMNLSLVWNLILSGKEIDFVDNELDKRFKKMEWSMTWLSTYSALYNQVVYIWSLLFSLRSLTETSGSQKPSGGRSSSQTLNGPTDSHPRHARDVSSRGTDGKPVLEEKRASIPNTNSRVPAAKSNNSHPNPTTLASSSSAVGVYSSSTDPVHVPSPDSRYSGAVGAIKREVGVVGVRRQSSENSVKTSAMPSSLSNSLLGKDGSSTEESLRPLNTISRTDQLSQTTTTDTVIANMSVSRTFLSNQYNSRPHQLTGHQKGILVENELCF
jgi:hypothetical protein